jgi:hypothetical protein
MVAPLALVVVVAGLLMISGNYQMILNCPKSEIRNQFTLCLSKSTDYTDLVIGYWLVVSG